MHVAVCILSQKVFLGNGVNFALNILPQFFMYANLTPLFSVFTVTTNENRSIFLCLGVSFRAVANIAGTIHNRWYYIYRVIQEERSIFWEMIVSIIVRSKVHTTMCIILNAYRNRAVWMYKYKSVVNGNEEREIAYCKFTFNCNLRFKWEISFTEMTDLLQFTINVRKSHRRPQCTS